jgi:hypothetical protein
MQYLSTLGTASGRAGGLVASRGRAGAQLRAHRPGVQPRTAAQQNARALTGSLGPVWRGLSPARQASWAALAKGLIWQDALGLSFAPGGYAVFLSCNRNLRTFGSFADLLDAPAKPALPPLSFFEATPVYDNSDDPHALTGFSFAYGPALQDGQAGILRVTRPASPAKWFFRPSDYRVACALNPFPSEAFSVTLPLDSILPGSVSSGLISFELNLVDPFSGFAGAPVRASVAFRFSRPNPPVSGSVTISFEGVPEAVLADQVIAFNDGPEAGG